VVECNEEEMKRILKREYTASSRSKRGDGEQWALGAGSRQRTRAHRADAAQLVKSAEQGRLNEKATKVTESRWSSHACGGERAASNGERDS